MGVQAGRQENAAGGELPPNPHRQSREEWTTSSISRVAPGSEMAANRSELLWSARSNRSSKSSTRTAPKTSPAKNSTSSRSTSSRRRPISRAVRRSARLRPCASLLLLLPVSPLPALSAPRTRAVYARHLPLPLLCRLRAGSPRRARVSACIRLSRCLCKAPVEERCHADHSLSNHLLRRLRLGFAGRGGPKLPYSEFKRKFENWKAAGKVLPRAPHRPHRPAASAWHKRADC